MTPNDYQELAMKTSGTTTFIDGLVVSALGLAGETGEYADSIKKFVSHGHNLDHEHIKKELGDIAWYLVLACDTLDFQFEDVLATNIEKLRKRYPDGFSSERSINREEYQTLGEQQQL